MTEIKICHCGTNHEALEAALKLARQAFKPESGDCTIWAYAVSEAFRTIAFNMSMAKLRMINKSMDNKFTDGHLREEAARGCAETGGLIFVATHDNPTTAEISKFICEEMGIGDAEEQEKMNKGPSEDTIREAGLGHLLPSSNPENTGLADLLKALGFKTVQFGNMSVSMLDDEEPEPGSKPH